MMYSGRYIWVALGLLAVAEGNWVYDWPYEINGACRCKKIDLPTGFPDESACVKAFSTEPYEYCWSAPDDGPRVGGITESDCANYAVSASATHSNMDCEMECLKLVVGSISQTAFFQQCRLETVARSGSSVSPAPSSCFVNYVLGHADFDSAKADDSSIPPLRIFEEVESAAKCQSLCQQLDNCAWFQWRATADDTCNLPDGATPSPRPAHSCELYSYDFVEAVLAFAPSSSASSSTYVGGVCDLEQYENHGCNDLFKTSSWSPFTPVKCLSCDCEPKCAFNSYSHISGPAYCDRKNIATSVCSIKPPFPHTTPSPPTTECTTQECPTPPTRPPTQPTFSSATTATGFSTRPPTQPTYTTASGETTATQDVTTQGHTETTRGLTSTTGWDSTTPQPDTTTGFETTGETTTGFATTGYDTTTGFETSTAGGDTTLPNTTTPGRHTETGKPCPCPSPDCECPCEDCVDANWEPQDLIK